MLKRCHICETQVPIYSMLFFLAFEAAEAERMQQELAAHEAALEREAEDERKKNDKAILALNTRKEALLKEKKTKAKQEISKLIQQGASKEEQDALLKEHSKDLAKLMNKMDADRMRMQSQLENRLKKKRDERRQSKLKELERKSDEAKEDFKEQLDSEKDKLKSDATMILKERTRSQQHPSKSNLIKARKEVTKEKMLVKMLTKK